MCRTRRWQSGTGGVSLHTPGSASESRSAKGAVSVPIISGAWRSRPPGPSPVSDRNARMSAEETAPQHMISPITCLAARSFSRRRSAAGHRGAPRPAPPQGQIPPALLTLEVGVGVLVAALGLLLAVGLGLHGLPVEADHPPAVAGRLPLAGIPQPGEILGGEAHQVGRPVPQHLHRVALQQLGEARRDLDAHGAGGTEEEAAAASSPPPRPAGGCSGGGLGPPSAGAD